MKKDKWTYKLTKKKWYNEFPYLVHIYKNDVEQVNYLENFSYKFFAMRYIKNFFKRKKEQEERNREILLDTGELENE